MCLSIPVAQALALQQGVGYKPFLSGVPCLEPLISKEKHHESALLTQIREKAGQELCRRAPQGPCLRHQ